MTRYIIGPQQRVVDCGGLWCCLSFHMSASGIDQERRDTFVSFLFYISLHLIAVPPSRRMCKCPEATLVATSIMATLSRATSNSSDIGHPVVEIFGSGVIASKLLRPMRICQPKRYLLHWQDTPSRTQHIPEGGLVSWHWPRSS